MVEDVAGDGIQNVALGLEVGVEGRAGDARFLQDVLDRPDKCAILRQLCAFRQANLDALAYGNLLDELRFAGFSTRCSQTQP